jgi:hypothetical protein
MKNCELFKQEEMFENLTTERKEAGRPEFHTEQASETLKV